MHWYNFFGFYIAPFDPRTLIFAIFSQRTYKDSELSKMVSHQPKPSNTRYTFWNKSRYFSRT